jgi:hypothetical protein
VSAKGRKNLNQRLKRVQHDNRVRVSFFCHPEPGPEPCPETSNVILNSFQDQGLLTSGSNDFGISVLGFKNLGFKAPPCGRGSLLPDFFRNLSYGTSKTIFGSSEGRSSVKLFTQTHKAGWMGRVTAQWTNRSGSLRI